MWSSARLALLQDLRIFAAENVCFCHVVISPVNSSVAFFKTDIDECWTDCLLLEMLHKRLDILQPRCLI